MPHEPDLLELAVAWYSEGRFLLPAFTVIGVAAWYLCHRRYLDEAKVMIAIHVILASILVPAGVVRLQMGAENLVKQRVNRRLLRC